MSLRRVFLGSILMVSALANGAQTPSSIPENARASRYGDGWECMTGFRREANACARIAVPANGYLDSSGSRWRCNRGYLRVDETCAAVKVPQHAYLDDSTGPGWKCERGYREAQGRC